MDGRMGGGQRRLSGRLTILRQKWRLAGGLMDCETEECLDSAFREFIARYVEAAQAREAAGIERFLEG